MKYLKLFEELKSETYNKAAAKLKQMGHERRSKALYDWSDIVQKRETLERWSKLGTFDMTFYQNSWNSSTKISIILSNRTLLPFGNLLLRTYCSCLYILLPFPLPT